jgi:hypothetical protein
MSDSQEQLEPVLSLMRERLIGSSESKISSLATSHWPEIAQKILELSKILATLNTWRVEDQQGSIFLNLGCMFLSTYRTMEPYFEDKNKFLDVLRDVIVRVYLGDNIETFLKDNFGISRDAPDEAWDRFCENFIPLARKKQGRGWILEYGIRDHKRFFVNVRKCVFAEFLLAEGARDLLYQFCSLDYAAADELEKCGIRFSRPTMLSEGSNLCRLQYFRI